ncbi:iron-sulfur cluster biosynthesis family protein [Metabacillus litoralis]|jgi:Fe-S cluster assembly iron-binding protein IscA|uniref:iron-sulfur cluster biosynthesis family protein n=1 Tax=Metabacillus litoralis TaxID=152268 RepID=UPI00204127F7|nr:iron-sulfur cluster biosynthesis family protein [Metabacillus litoralis]MCM3651949.1 iron-sulfur cluster biosynthesis family protein [Metabacillus litoralis]
MVITLTDAALKKLKEKMLVEQHSPRIDADIAGGCGISVKFSLVFDESRRNDTVIEYDEIQIRIDKFTKRYLDEETQIDYSDEQGFLVGESFESSACSIEII